LKLSVIIPTRNRAGLLHTTLKSIALQTFPSAEFEVIVVDNGSTDNTKQIVDNCISSIRNIRYFYDATPGLHIGRHLGLKEAKAELLVYADDDIEAFPEWLEGIWESFQDNEVALVGGKNLPKWETEPPYWIYEMWMEINKYGHSLGYLSILDFGNEIMEIDPCYIWGCNFSIRKKTLLEAKGFHPDAFPQDMIKYRGDGETSVSNYIRKKSYKTIYNPKASVYHFVPKNRMTVDYFCKRAFNQGISDSFADIRKKLIYD
jgi:glycosyltransferase involved in cell wall biosynthesis